MAIDVLQPASDGGQNTIRVVRVVRKPQMPGNLAVTAFEVEVAGGADPEHRVVLVPVLVAELDGRLGLADATQPADRLAQRGPARLAQPLAEVGNLFTPSGEPWVSRGQSKIGKTAVS